MACLPLSAESTSSSVVKIESANRTDYVKDAETADELICFTGNVILNVTKNDQVIDIQADSVIYNRTRSSLYAEGNIIFSRSKKGSASEELTAQTLLFNIDTLEGVFDQGRVMQEQSDSINLPSGSSLFVASSLFGRDNSGTVAFDTGTLTFCDDPDPHWQIKATRIWLLPGNEFSFFNAVLYVGHLPVMYFPFFYYPKDEMLFNPVFSYDARRGYSFQTTTYIIGRKPLPEGNDDDGLFSFMRTTQLKKQEREGLFLKNLEENDTMGSNSLKVMADVYSNLGVMAGIEGAFKPAAVVSDIAFKSYFGFSNTLFPSGERYTTFSPSTAQQYTDSAWLLGREIPFRFYGDLTLKIAKSPFSLNLTLPVYSDIYFTGDFLNRSESMDWINYLLENPVMISDSDTDSSDSSTKTSFSWNLSASVSTPEFIKNLNPYLSTFSISSLTSAVNFNSMDNASVTGETEKYTPASKFFYPASLYPLKMSLSIGGTLLSSQSKPEKKTNPVTKKTESSSGETEKKRGTPAELEPPLLVSTVADSSSSEEDESQKEENTVEIMASLSFPALSSTTVSGLAYSLTYSLSPSISTEMYFDSSTWHSPEDIDWENVKSSYLSVKTPATLKDSISWKNNFVSLSNSFSFQHDYQEHPVVSETAYPEGSSALTSLRKADYQAQKLNLSAVSALSLKPFTLIPVFSDTSLTWNNTVKIIRSEFTGTVDEPEWEYTVADWDPDSITSHDMTLVLSAKDGTFNPKMTFKANLPPQTESYTGSFSFGYRWLSLLSVSSTYKKKSKTDETWVFTPLSQSSNWSFGDKKLTVTQNYSYNIEDEHSESLSLSLSGFGLSASYSMGWTKPYELVSGRGWVAQQENDFIPKSASLSYSMPSKTYNSWFNRISFQPKLSTSLNVDLLRPTDSSFVFTPSFTFKINKLMDLTFSSESRNQVIFRYIQDLYDYDVRMPGETDIFVDLFDSFAFWDTDLRKASGFKLKNVSVKLTHELHDWVLNSEFKVEPRLLTEETTNRKYYDFSPYFTLSVVWRPMSSMKTTIQDKYGTFILNPD
ncbi:MAG: LPS-assembly protein LptD [Treponema sp.]|nr:LPS-assembly protein LptD [Candidatus Treponema caballi]